ncbi:MAG: hypothetical protein BAJALOKI2v1_430024 [Promethearchaeota archaeon]|nr:MAG: hypothetical protein BAJALOKI2v1_430024 [Candidatus Lokiarchaeota archaeon]
MPENIEILNDISKIFIPFRSVLEMETITSTFLETLNYDRLKEVPKTQPSSDKLISILKLKDNPLAKSVDYFINTVLAKVKPIVMYARDHHDINRRGNVIPYIKTRISIFFALHRLKVKFLIIKNFFDKLQAHYFNKDVFLENDSINDKSLLSLFYEYYYKKNLMNLHLMLPKSKKSKRVVQLLNNRDTITNEKLLNMVGKKYYNNKNEQIKFIMREIKASLFTCKLIFARMDVFKPFITKRGGSINIEELMISNDFIPELIPAMSESLDEENYKAFENYYRAFRFMLRNSLEGINYAISLASDGQLSLDLEEPIYTIGNLFEEL